MREKGNEDRENDHQTTFLKVGNDEFAMEWISDFYLLMPPFAFLN